MAAPHRTPSIDDMGWLCEVLGINHGSTDGVEGAKMEWTLNNYDESIQSLLIHQSQLETQRANPWATDIIKDAMKFHQESMESLQMKLETCQSKLKEVLERSVESNEANMKSLLEVNELLLSSIKVAKASLGEPVDNFASNEAGKYSGKISRDARNDDGGWKRVPQSNSGSRGSNNSTRNRSSSKHNGRKMPSPIPKHNVGAGGDGSTFKSPNERNSKIEKSMRTPKSADSATAKFDVKNPSKISPDETPHKPKSQAKSSNIHTPVPTHRNESNSQEQLEGRKLTFATPKSMPESKTKPRIKKSSPNGSSNPVQTLAIVPYHPNFVIETLKARHVSIGPGSKSDGPAFDNTEKSSTMPKATRSTIDSAQEEKEKMVRLMEEAREQAVAARAKKKERKKSKISRWIQQQEAMNKARADSWLGRIQKEEDTLQLIHRMLIVELVRQSNKVCFGLTEARVASDEGASDAIRVESRKAMQVLFVDLGKCRVVVKGCNIKELNFRNGNLRHWVKSKKKFLVGLDTKKSPDSDVRLLEARHIERVGAGAKAKTVPPNSVQIDLDGVLTYGGASLSIHFTLQRSHIIALGSAESIKSGLDVFRMLRDEDDRQSKLAEKSFVEEEEDEEQEKRPFLQLPEKMPKERLRSKKKKVYNSPKTLARRNAARAETNENRAVAQVDKSDGAVLEEFQQLYNQRKQEEESQTPTIPAIDENGVVHMPGDETATKKSSGVYWKRPSKVPWRVTLAR